MEKKKLLLIAVSLGIFLVIVIGLSILIFAPKKDTATSSGTMYAGAVASTSDTSEDSLPATTPITLPESSVSDDTPAKNVGTSTSSPSVTVEIVPPTSTSSTSFGSASSSESIATKSIPVPVTSTAIRPTTTISGATQSASTSAPTTTSSQSATRASTTTANSQSAAASTTTASSQSAARASTTTTRVATPSVSTVSTTRQIQPVSSDTSTNAQKPYESYWVQAGAFSTQIRAEDVKETLKTKGLAAVIETHNVQGRDFYRVRIGPYTSQNEADYWLALIKGINGFEESQIWQNNVVR